jgi:MFS family permease
VKEKHFPIVICAGLAPSRTAGRPRPLLPLRAKIIRQHERDRLLALPAGKMSSTASLELDDDFPGHPRPAAPSASMPLWLTIVLCSVANALNQADRNIIPIAIIPMGDELAFSLIQRGVVLSSFAWGYIFVQLPSGWLATRVPPLRLLLFAVFAWSLSTLLTPTSARAGGFSLLFLCRVAMGLAEGFCLPAIFQHFACSVGESWRSSAFGAMIASGNAGQLLALYVCPLIAQWDLMFVSFGAAGLAWCALCTCALATSFSSGGGGPTRSSIAPLGGRRGSSAAADEALQGIRLTSSAGLDGGEGPASAAAVLRPWSCSCGGTPWRRLLGCPAVHAIVLAHFAQNWTNYTMSSWLPTYLHGAHGMETQQLWLTAIPFAVSAVSGTLTGLLADAALARRYVSVLTVRRAATMAGLLGPASCLLMLSISTSPAVAIAVMTVSNLLGSATNAGYMANHADLSTTHAGLTFAVANTAATVPGLVAGPLTAWILDGDTSATAPWGLVFGLASAINVMGALAYWRLARAHRVL